MCKFSTIAIYRRLRNFLLCCLMISIITPVSAHFKAGVLWQTNGNISSMSWENDVYNYHNTDHLGNNREVMNAKSDVQQLTNYYPFGVPYADPVAVMGSTVQQYKYNGKELDVMHGLNTYDFGARQYYPILGRQVIIMTRNV